MKYSIILQWSIKYCELWTIFKIAISFSFKRSISHPMKSQSRSILILYFYFIIKRKSSFKNSIIYLWLLFYYSLLKLLLVFHSMYSWSVKAISSLTPSFGSTFSLEEEAEITTYCLHSGITLNLTFAFKGFDILWTFCE